MKSSIIDNYKTGILADYLKENIEPDSKLSIISAYFTIYAYQALKRELDGVNKVQFLFGEPTFLKQSKDLDKKVFKIDSGDREKNVGDIQSSISLKDRLRQKSAAIECAEWIKEKVEVRSIVKPNFLHGKLYHIDKKDGSQVSVMGSSNFTVSGIGLGNSIKNIEMNLITDSLRNIKELKDWFLDIWNDNKIVEDVKDEVINYIMQFYEENSPELIYYLTLFHVFKEFLKEQENSIFEHQMAGFQNTKVWNMLYDFQKDGAKGAISKLEKHNGCILADSVGLGKTFEALAVIKYYELRNYKVLVICPKKLRENWLLYRNMDNRNILSEDRFGYDVINHTDLSRTSGYSGYMDLSNTNWGNYDLVVIDESHNFRNNKSAKGRTSRYTKLMEDIIKSGVRTKVLMLSATPVNNNLKDLRNQLYFITEGRDEALLESCGIANIAFTVKGGQEAFNKWTALPLEQRNRDKLLDMINTDFFKLLDELTIARSRSHIEKYYDINSIGKFPERLKPQSIHADIDVKEQFISYEKIDEIISSLNLAIFSPSYYITRAEKEKYKKLYDTELVKGMKFSQEERENALVGMIKINYLKRLESSINSFAISINRLIEAIEGTIKKIDSFEDNDGEVLETGSMDLDEETLEEEAAVGKSIKIFMKDMDLVRWRKDLEADRQELYKIYRQAVLIDSNRDNKLKMLKEVIKDKMQNPINNNNKKVLVFTAFADTANYIYEQLESWCGEELGLHIALVTGAGTNKTTYWPKELKNPTEFNTILTNFSPCSKGRDKMPTMPQTGEIDILIATDCISEGQNLQDCDFLVNYDIHWNPVRIIQRFGRIDRLQSKNERIQLVNFWPTKDLNKYINLKDRVEARMTLVDISATGHDNLLNEDGSMTDRDLEYRSSQLVRLKDEVIDLEDMNEGISLTDFNMNDFRVDLMNFMKTHENMLKRLPLGMHAVVPALSESQTKFIGGTDSASAYSIVKPGVIYCIKEKENSKSERYNPVYPYFLAYVYEDGTVRYGFSNIKQIFDIYRYLCLGKKEVYASLCNAFNTETENCSNMDKYSQMLDKFIDHIQDKTISSNRRELTRDRRAKLMSKNESTKEQENFELISFLVIK